MRRSSILRTTGLALIGVAAVAAFGTLIARDQMSRHRRDLFSGHALERFAALGYIAGTPPTVELVQLLRDFCRREPNRILQRRATQIVTRMERQLEAQTAAAALGSAG